MIVYMYDLYVFSFFLFVSGVPCPCPQYGEIVGSGTVKIVYPWINLICRFLSFPFWLD